MSLSETFEIRKWNLSVGKEDYRMFAVKLTNLIYKPASQALSELFILHSYSQYLLGATIVPTYTRQGQKAHKGVCYKMYQVWILSPLEQNDEHNHLLVDIQGEWIYLKHVFSNMSNRTYEINETASFFKDVNLLASKYFQILKYVK